jgi:GNAT superfamily N-acetyltransferase
VRQAYRGKGYGNGMLKKLAEIAVERHCGRFEWSVLDWNEPAINFYKAKGAEIMPEWRICRVTGEALTTLARPA